MEITVLENTSTTSTNTGSITIVSGNKTITIDVTQDKKTLPYTVTVTTSGSSLYAKVTNVSSATYKFTCVVTRLINNNVVSTQTVVTNALGPGESDTTSCGTFPSQAGYSMTVEVTS